MPVGDDVLVDNLAVDLLALGGAHVDRTARLIESHIKGASNPATFSQHVGGGAFNAARAAKLRGIESVAMMSVRGGDAAGSDVETAIDLAGILDFSGSFMDRHTPTYTAILEPEGELVTAIADMALYDTGFDRQVRRLEGRERIAAADALLVDANVPEAALESATQLTEAPIFGMCISPAKAKRLLAIAPHIDVLFLNRRELTALTNESPFDEQISRFLEHGFKAAVISDGGNEIIVLDNERIERLVVPKIENLVDVTGAGDALAGGTIASLLSGDDIALTDHVMFGIASASLTLQADGPVCQSLTSPEFAVALDAAITAQP